MFRFFRINDPYRLLFVLLILVLLRIVVGVVGVPYSIFELKWLTLGQRLGDGFLMYKEAYDHTGPLAAGVYKVMDLIFGKSRIAHQLVATAWLFVNAAMFNLMLNRNKAFSENNYLPALLIILSSIAIPDFFALSPILMGSTFVILSLNNVFRRIDNEITDELFLYAGIYLGIGTLFYLPLAIYYFFFLVSFLLFSNPIIRRVLLYTYGFFLPLLIVFAYYYWFEAHTYFIDAYLIRGTFGEAIWQIEREHILFLILVPGAWLILSLFNTFFAGSYTSYQSKINQVLFITLLAGCGALWLDVIRAPHQLMLFILPLAFFMTQYVLVLRQRYLKHVIPILMIISFVMVPFFVYPYLEGSVTRVQSGQAGYTDRRIMVLSDSFDYYADQHIAGPALDPELTQAIFTQVSYYSFASDVFESINRSAPEVIIDDWNLMPGLFDRFPVLKEKYRPGSNNRYFLRTSN